LVTGLASNRSANASAEFSAARFELGLDLRDGAAAVAPTGDISRGIDK
jgi:hypothetical protein